MKSLSVAAMRSEIALKLPLTATRVTHLTIPAAQSTPPKTLLAARADALRGSRGEDVAWLLLAACGGLALFLCL